MSLRLSPIRNAAQQYKLSKLLDTLHILIHKRQLRNVQNENVTIGLLLIPLDLGAVT